MGVIRMMRGLKLILLLIAAPLIAMFASSLILNDIEGQWKAAIVTNLGAEAASKAADLEWLCANRPEVKAAFPEACTEITVMRLMDKAAIGALALGLALVASIYLAGRLAGNRRDLLWRIFTPGLRITIFGLVFLIIVHAALVMATVWYGESALTGRVHVQFIGLVGVGAAAGVISMSRAALTMVRKATSSVRGRPLSRDAHPEIWRFVENVARKLGTAPPAHIIAGLFPSFFVTESDVQHPGGLLTGRTLYLSTSLCRILTKPELEAIIGHELGHFRGEDTAFSQRFYPIYRGTEEALVALVQHSGGARNVALLPAIYTLSFFMESFARAESAVSREREFLADQAGAEAAGTRPMASALAKVHAFVSVWKQVPSQIEELLNAGQPVESAGALYASLVRQAIGPHALEGLDAQQMPHPIDSHPPLSQRLAALGTSLDEVSEAALLVAPDEPALGLFTAGEELEAQLTADAIQRRA